jgi:hypothetical protein
MLVFAAKIQPAGAIGTYVQGWSRTYGGTSYDEAYALVQTTEGGYALAGYTDSFGAGGDDFWLVKTDASGTMQWSKTYGGKGSEKAEALVQTTDGGYALAGFTRSFGAGNYDAWLVKTDAGGTMQWNKTYGGTNVDYALALVQTVDGGYALAGETQSFGAGGWDFWLIKTDSAGNMKWNKTYGGTSDDWARSLVQTADGGYVLAGWTKSFGAGSYDSWLVKTDASGTMQWNKTYGGTSDDEAEALARTADGGYALAGTTYSFGAGNFDAWLIKTDGSGTMQWNKTYGGTNVDMAFALVQTADGGYALVIFTSSFGSGGYDAWLVKTDAGGTMRWNKTYGGTGRDDIEALVQTGDGGYALAGLTYSFGAGNSDFWLIKAFGPLSVSISPSSVFTNVGQPHLFNSSVEGGNSPYTYQWYLDGAPVSDATNPTWTFTPTSVSSHTVSLVVNDSATPPASAQSNNASVTVFPFTGFIIVKSEYDGYFIQNLPFNNTFGVYTSHNGTSPVNVTANLSNTKGNPIVHFSNVMDSSGAYLSEIVDMGNLSPNATLQVSAVYSDGMILNESFPIKVIPTPSWLVSILDKIPLITVEPQIQGQWDNTYEISVEQELDLSSIFTIPIKLPTFAGGGNYTLLPSVEFGFSFYSNGTCEISSSGIGQLVPIQFGVGSVTAHINVTVTGEIALVNNSVTWISASFSLDIGASASVNIPLPIGYTFDLPVLGKVTIGLSATVTFNADFGATIVLAPTQNNSEELISGIGIMIQSITGKISFGAGIAITAGCAVASITGRGDIEVNVYLQGTRIPNSTIPYINQVTVIGTVSIDYHVLFWSGTIWEMTGTLYNWTQVTPIEPIQTNFTVAARYYNTSDYEEFTWTNGSLAGTAIHDVYPLTKISATSTGDTAYILYTDDNVSMPTKSGLCWKGLEFNSSQKTLASLSLPPISGEIFFSPVVISLPNGSLLAMWGSTPFSEVDNASGPVAISTVIPQYSCFDTNTQSWGPIENLEQSGVTTSYLLSSDSAECYALVLQGDSLFSNNQSLIEYDLQNGSKLLSIRATNASNIVSFDCVSRLAVLRMLDGSYELLNLSSSQLINLPSMEECQVKMVQLATNSTDSVGVLYGNVTSDIFSIYNISSGTISFSMNVSQSTSFLTLSERVLEAGGLGFQLVTTDSSGMTSYFIYAEDQSEKSLFYPIENITSMDTTITDDGVLAYTTENYGNSSYPLLDLTLTSIPRKGTGDLNNDGEVSLQDLTLLAIAYKSKPGGAKWNPNADIDSNGVVGLIDLTIMAIHYGQHYP